MTTGCEAGSARARRIDARDEDRNFNVNGVIKRLANLERWLAEKRPDVITLQEIKCRDTEFPFATLDAAGYSAIVRGQGPHHGVALLTRGDVAIETRRDLPGQDHDREARYIEAAVGGILFCAIYLPNGNPQPGPKFDYKLAWFERLIAHAAAYGRKTFRRSFSAISTSSRPTSISTLPDRGRKTRYGATSPDRLRPDTLHGRHKTSTSAKA